MEREGLDSERGQGEQGKTASEETQDYIYVEGQRRRMRDSKVGTMV